MGEGWVGKLNITSIVSHYSTSSRINLRDFNPVRGEMFIEAGTTKHIFSSARSTREEAACYGKYIHTNICSYDLCGLYVWLDR
jgi:hypothetical protein